MQSEVEMLDLFEEAQSSFLAAFPQFEETRALDELRARDYARLDRLGHTYLDYTGGGLYGESQIQKHQDLLRHNVFGNPHSENPTSLAMTELVKRCRRQVLAFFDAPEEEYVVVFTSNASAALKLIGESYPFGPGDHYLLTFDNHNSVNGIREFVRARGATTSYVPILLPEMRVEETELDRLLELESSDGHNLFAYPAQSNFSGTQHPLDWIPKAQAKGTAAA